MRTTRISRYATFGEVARREGVGPFTVWRWHRHGLRGGAVKLRAIKRGGRWVTRWRWVREFYQRLDPEHGSPPLETKKERRGERAAADAAADELGI